MEDRAAGIRAERRARRAAGGSNRLATDEHKLDREKFQYRWVNDVGTRVNRLKEFDYEVVPNGDEKITGTTKEGRPQNTVLMRKPRALHDEDAAALLAEIDAEENRMVSGKAHEMGPGGYVPKDTPIEIGGKRGR